jgi:tRNA A-37 threonylcarbamoyl transferase component Bud32
MPAEAPEGLCPRCVLGVGLATHTEAPGEFGPHGTKVLQPPPPPDEIAKHFPQLEVLECLGRGGMGMVYKARQLKLNRLVALKILAPEKGADPRFAERFLREAQSLARLSHPNIVAVHDFGEADGFYYLLMEYVDGLTLRQLLQAHRVLPEEALRIVPKICEALQFAHDQGIVHRDIKPENVLLDKQGTVKIADFGIAKLVGVETARAALTEEQSVLGTPHYMAPEQLEKPQSVDHRADIYSLGVVFYEMLTGELPLGRFLPPSQKVQVDVRLDEVVLHALAKEPERRYQHASEVKSDLETIAAAPSPAPEPGKTPVPVHIKGWRDFWPWDPAYYSLFLIAPPIVAGLLLPVLVPCWGLKALWLFALEVPGAGFAVMYAVVGSRVRRLKAALPQPTGEVAECLMFRKPFQSPGLAVLHEDRLELLPIAGSNITVPLAAIVAVSEVRWFNGTRLWFKKGFVMELANGQRVGVAVAEVFARRWRSRLSRGALPEIVPDAERAARTPRAGMADRASGGAPRLSRVALWGALWVPLFVIVGLMIASPLVVNEGSSPTGPAWWQIALRFTLLPLGVAAPFGTTILGWVAISQIRHSQGRLHGLGLAVFDALAYPLLVLDALILGVALLLLSASAAPAPGELVRPWASYWWVWLATLGVIAVADGLIAYAVWRTANKPSASAQPAFQPGAPGAVPAARSGGAGKIVALAATLLVLI